MNRKQRRARAARERAFAAGQRAAKTGKLPPGYMDQIRALAYAAREWIEREPGADLRWHDMTKTKTAIIAALEPVAFKYLAASPDAERLLGWLAPRHPEATLYQATWALKLIGQLEHPFEETHQSAAYRAVQRAAEQVRGRKEEASDFMPPSPCAQCGKALDMSSGPDGQKPTPGDFSVCIFCGGLNRFGEGLALEAVSEADLADAGEELRDQLAEFQSLIRSRARRRGGPVPAA